MKNSFGIGLGMMVQYAELHRMALATVLASRHHYHYQLRA